MSVKVPSTIVVTLDITPEELSSQVDVEINKAIKQVTIKGFRKGKAPRELAISQLDSEKITQKAVATLLPIKLEKSLLQEKENSGRSRVILIKEPHYEIEEYGSKDNTLKCKVTCELYPEVNIEDVENIKIKKTPPHNTTDDDVKNFIQRLYQQYQSMKRKADETQQQDAVPDYGQIITDANFLKTMHAVDEQDLIKRAREELEVSAKYNAEVTNENNLITEMIKTVSIDLPDTMIQREIDRLKSELKKQLNRIGARFEDYLNSRQSTESEIESEMSVQAKQNVSLMLILTELTQKWNIQLTQDEISEISKNSDSQTQATLELMSKQRKALELAKEKLFIE